MNVLRGGGGGGEGRVRISVLPQEVRNGGLAIPNI